MIYCNCGVIMKAELERLETILRLTNRALDHEHDKENSSFAGQAKRLQAEIAELKSKLSLPRGKPKRKTVKKKGKRKS